MEPPQALSDRIFTYERNILEITSHVWKQNQHFLLRLNAQKSQTIKRLFSWHAITPHMIITGFDLPAYRFMSLLH